jgi:hypothetical protein
MTLSAGTALGIFGFDRRKPANMLIDRWALFSAAIAKFYLRRSVNAAN